MLVVRNKRTHCGADKRHQDALKHEELRRADLSSPECISGLLVFNYHP